MPRIPFRPSRWLVSALILCLISGTLALQPHARAATDLTLGADAEVADAQGDNVNLRDQPSYAGDVLTSVPEGWLVNVLDGPFTDDTTAPSGIRSLPTDRPAICSLITCAPPMAMSPPPRR